MYVKPEVERFAKIRVVGIGGAGCNVINTMIESQQIAGVEFVAVNTDAQALSINKAFVKVPIGQELTNGLGAGSNPEIGKKAAEESIEIIKQNLEGSDMVFVTAGMGGGTGTGASPVIAAVAKSVGALTVGVVTKPFTFEGAQRMRNAEKGIEALKSEVDALITIPNQKLLDIADDKMSVLDAFRISDSILNQGVQGISDLIVMPGLINVDFADVRTIMKDAGSALMGIGIGTGDDRAVLAARAAISSPLLEVSISGATGILFNVIGGRDLTMKEVDKAAKIIVETANPDANVIFGATIDDSLTDQIKITVIATGFDAEYRNRLGLDKQKREQWEAGQGFGQGVAAGVGAGLGAGSAVGAGFVAGQGFNTVAGGSVAQNKPDGSNKQTGTDKWKLDEFVDDQGSQYDIPAYLRGK